MASQFEQLIEALQWTFETHVKPAVHGSLAQSYARTLSVMLGQARDRAREEHRALHEELADLRRTLQDLRRDLPEAEGLRAERVLARAASSPGAFVALEDLEREIAELDAIAAAALPALTEPARARVDAMTLRRIERRRRWMPDVAPSDAF